MSKAVVLLSGGLDSATILYYAINKGYQVNCLIFDYGQRHQKEIKNAIVLARKSHSSYKMVRISLPWQGSSLLNKKEKIPQRKRIDPKEIPSTYVPARNIIFLSFAVSFAEAIGAWAVFIGANAIDYSGYPDCRGEFFEAYQHVIRRGMKSGVKGKLIKIFTPLLKKTKKQIIQMGLKLNVPYSLTWSCYMGGKRPCGKCDSCLLRTRGFADAGIIDPSI